MLELSGKCCNGIKAIEFMESLANIIDDDDKTDEFCEEYEASLNRFRYEVTKGIGKKIRVVKAVCKGYHHKHYCGKCGFETEEATWKYCPNCGTAIIR
jgi:predicted RNA-binding Zn-ribbon protein involved in translation (DUF1610 family)